MPTREEAARLIAELFDDEGVAVLGAGGTFVTWEQALAGLPDALFAVPSRTPGITLLTLARDLWSRQGHVRMATATTEGLVEVLTEELGEDHPEVLVHLGALGVLQQRGGHAEGHHLLEDAFAGLRSQVGGRDLRLAVVAQNLGLSYARQGRFADAEVPLSTALRIRQAEAPSTVALVAGQLGEVLLRLEKVTAGIDTLEVAWLAELDHKGERHPDTLRRMLQLARAQTTAGQYRRAVPLWRTLDEVAQESGHRERMAEIGFELGKALLKVHKREEGTRRMRDALRWTREASDAAGQDHPALATRLTDWANLEIENRRPIDAEGLLREAVDVQRRISGDNSPETARRQASLGTLLARLGRVDEALGYLDSAAMLLLTTDGPTQPSTRAALEATLGLIATKVEHLVAQKDRDSAGMMISHGIRMAGPALGFDHHGIATLRALASEHRIPLGG